MERNYVTVTLCILTFCFGKKLCFIFFVQFWAHYNQFLFSVAQ